MKQYETFNKSIKEKVEVMLKVFDDPIARQ